MMPIAMVAACLGLAMTVRSLWDIRWDLRISRRDHALRRVAIHAAGKNACVGLAQSAILMTDWEQSTDLHVVAFAVVTVALCCWSVIEWHMRGIWRDIL